MLVANQKGQTFIIILVIMIIALTIGIAVSARFTTNLRGIIRSDNASRAVAVSEAGVERLLLKSMTELKDYVTNNNCGTYCNLVITSPEGIKATAVVTLGVVGNSSQNYIIDLKANETKEINMLNYPANKTISVCWNNPASGDLPSMSALYVYGSLGSYTADSYAYNSIGTSHTDNNFSTAVSANGYSNCFSIPTSANSQLLRLKVHYNDATVTIVPSSGTIIPEQGILITSVGTSGGETRTVQVVKSPVTLPSQFDYIIYQRTPDSDLSN